MYKTLVSTAPRLPPHPWFEPQGSVRDRSNDLTTNNKSGSGIGVYKSSAFSGIHTTIVDYTD
jgi:hypothetical protein